MTKYTNKIIADNYVKAVVSRSEVNFDKKYIGKYNSIKNAKIDIVDFYKKNGTLKNLNEKGISKTMAHQIEMILKYGAEKAKNILCNKRTGLESEVMDFYNSPINIDVKDYADIESPDHGEESFP